MEILKLWKVKEVSKGQIASKVGRKKIPIRLSGINSPWKTYDLVNGRNAKISPFHPLWSN